MAVAFDRFVEAERRNSVEFREVSIKYHALAANFVNQLG
jgi:hypothetical protein